MKTMECQTFRTIDVRTICGLFVPWMIRTMDFSYLPWTFRSVWEF